MNFDKLKEANAQSSKKALSKEETKNKIIEILSRIPSEEETLRGYFNQLVLDKTAKLTPYKDKTGIEKYRGYQICCAYKWNRQVRYKWEQTKLESTAFIYDLIDNTLVRICRYETLAIYHYKPGAGHPELISNIVSCLPTTIKLTDDEVECLKNTSIYVDWIKDLGIICPSYNIPSIANPLEDSLIEMITDNSIMACEIEHYKSFDDDYGCTTQFILYPEKYQDGYRYMAKKELESKIDYTSIDDFTTEYRKLILNDIANTDFNEAIEKTLCEVMTKTDCSHEDKLHGKFSFYYPDERIYKLVNKQPNVELYAIEGASLNFECMNMDNDVIKFEEKDVISFGMSDTFWKYDDLKGLYRSTYLFSLYAREIFYGDTFYTALGEFYTSLKELIVKKMTETGLKITNCHVYSPDDDDKDDITVDIWFENPVYAGNN